ncbi:MAG: hypothetical protein IJX72_06245 [Clostridia bacterium]|nr:hypothetical protein [Clostridia bacterium]
MKPNKKQKTERIFTAFGDVSPDMIEAAERYRSKPVSKAVRYRRMLTVAIAAVLSLAVLTVTVFAAIPSLRRMINLPFLSESERQDTVPEGWIGVYTVEDLDNIRNDLSGKYILMNDITFTDGDAPFTPIGSAEEHFVGQFDGNGYVIRGLRLEATQETPDVAETKHTVNNEYRTVTYHDVESVPTMYVGLFSCCGESTIFPYFYSDKPYRGMIINLGIENATVTVENAANVCVGVLAGRASYVAGCYVKDSTVTVNGYSLEAEFGEIDLHAGGLTGKAQLVDSCYALDTEVTLGATRDLYVTPYNCFAGALAGDVYTMITSYSESCAVTSDHPDTVKGDLYGHVHLLPRLLNESQFLTVYERYYRATHGIGAEEPLPENWKSAYDPYSDADFYCRKFYSYYLSKSLSILSGDLGLDFNKMNPALLMGEFSPEMTMYILDISLFTDEIIKMENELVDKIGMETLCEIMTYDNFKVGPIDCYVLDSDQTYKKSDFSEFDFESIWEMKDGRPVLRIFGE